MDLLDVLRTERSHLGNLSSKGSWSFVLYFNCLQMHQAVQRMFAGCHRGAQQNDRTHSRHASQAMSHTFVVLSYRSRRPSTVFILLLLANSSGPRPKTHKMVFHWSRLPELMAVRTSASHFGMGAVLFHRGQPRAWMAIEGNKRDHKLLAAIPDIQLGRQFWLPETRGLCTSRLSAPRSFKQARPQRCSTSNATPVRRQL